ncbi:MAG: SPOR domain-containing protein [Erythrobacter sp.]|uniref:SPOR domain-containing protein n=1 Tax=Erythrobacter sp. TaxID=1042 RepID=UPI0025FBEB02|nr:SPOR domain-containing protein [Erythrobacter sp.]MCL9998132.1 SPOR domain-containing protein [Erythrobacter sp.]
MTAGSKKAMMAGAALVGAAGALLAAAPALADVKAGVDAWTAGDFARAVVEWQGPAAAGDPDALFNLAQAYRLGRGVEIDNARARQLYEQAAALGHVKAADNFGLMLFQEGEQQKAMPLIQAAADRGDPRAQYVLGLSHFNADYAPRDWTRAYALMTLANSSGLPQAREALAQMDKYVPQAQRAQAQSLARELEAGARSQRQAELAAAELATRPAASVVPAVAAAPTPKPATKPPVVTVAAAAPKPMGLPPAPKPITSAPAPAPAQVTLASAPKGSTVTPVPAALAPRKQGSWRVQLGAFGVAGNADKLWSQLGGHAALAGTRKTLVPSGNLTRLLATGFASEAEAGRACAALKREGKACVVAGQG